MTDQTPLHGTDWEPQLGHEFGKKYWICLQECIEQERSCYEVYPGPDEVLAALHLTQYSDTRVVIVGQDPYHSHGLAHGLAFSVRRNVKKKRFPRSLRNIIRALQEDPELPTHVRESDPGHGNLEIWAGRGVLLINSTLTVREGVPGSHHGMGWDTFTNRVIREVERASPVFMLWGKEAQRKRKLLVNTPAEMIIESPHPRTAAFPQSQPFSRANNALKDPMDWSLME